MLDSGGTATASAAGFAGADLTGGSLAGGFRTDARALVPFSRTMVTTTAKDGLHQLNVASAALERPPEGSLMAPLEVLNPSSPFGLRVSPISGAAGDFHLGQDFAAACGTRVYSADSGVVRAAGWHPWGGGNRVEIDHGNGLITTYNHLEAIAVHTGDSVHVGQVIARVGTTGWSTGCHLHFETILGGKYTDPLNWTLIPIKQVDGLSEIAMVSYQDKSPDSAATLNWAIPSAPDQSQAVVGGENELLQAPAPGSTIPTTAPTTSPPAPITSPTPKATSSGPASRPSTPTPTHGATSPSTAASVPKSTSTAVPTPTPTPTPTQTTTAPRPAETVTTPDPLAPAPDLPPITVSPTPTGSSAESLTQEPSGTRTATASVTATGTPSAGP